MTRTIGIFAAVTLALLAAGCQRETGPDPLKLTGKMFVFNYRLAYAVYTITLQKTEAVPEGSVVIATFENPVGGAPFTLTRKLFPRLDRVVLESPDLTCVKKEKPYAVTIEVKGPAGETLQKLETTVTSDIDQDILPAKALVEGPAYDKNPEVFIGGKAPKYFETAKCPI
ncbi:MULTISPECIES: hypothetical protein [unclassified Ensifer]|uniref:hypothetical protein n=1 Tax=unclassified Ensifer TaxID=2633371 RepID=UPI0008130EA2|nr:MULTISPECIES: hypothetical protein [unclassified Ensifer]OCP01381.1 hypothetical protein BC362_23450 [Ensifer sp. LC14]OCP03272.1 hypothetical protein BBX50_06575 [Ensifer sp. LC11]OCP03643.1 hypothetical protein BC374_06630 [Ensifer sp. LC13]OCP34056.1 hypothetical protein BC364_14120 [Ensifer sp. LC499]